MNVEISKFSFKVLGMLIFVIFFFRKKKKKS